MVNRKFKSASPLGSRSNQVDLGRIGFLLKGSFVPGISKRSETIETETITTTTQSPLPTKDDEARNQAAHRVYRRYGTNLAAFRRDVEREVTAQNETTEENEPR